MDDPDDEMSAAKARKKMIWRRIRRTCYIGAAAVFVLLTGTCIYGYFAWPVPNPDELAKETQQTITINYASGQEFSRITPKGGPKTMIRDLHAEVADPMIKATLAAEDASFYSNPGFDIKGILGAVANQFVGGAGGGSTITQQYVKLALDKDAPTYTRKIQEVVVAFKVTNQQSKDEILRAYLNTAYYGRGANGIHAASEAYFGKLPKDLTPSEAAVLGGMVQRPSQNDPRVDKEQAQSRWDYVARRMLETKGVTKQQRDEMQLPMTRERDEWRGEGLTGPQYDIRRKVLSELEQQGWDETKLSKGGYTITLNIDPKAQAAAEKAVDQVTGSQPKNLRTSLVAVEPKTGQVKAYYGGGKEIGGWDYADAPQPAGSSFKPFVVLAGLRDGLGIGEFYDGRAPQTIAGTEFNNSEGVACTVPDHCGVREAMDKSVNTVFVNLAVRVGASKVAKTAHDAGIPTDYNGTATLQNPDGGVDAGIALGMYPVKPIDMAAAYGTFVNEGKQVKPRFVSKIENNEGAVPMGAPVNKPALASTESDAKNLAANLIESMLGVAEHSKIPLDSKRPVASKTGTHQLGASNQNQNAWMVGATPQISAAVGMLAEENGKVAPVKDSSGKAVYGGKLPGHVWQAFMNAYHEGMKVEQFPKPTKRIGQFDDVPPPAPSTAPPSQPAPTSSMPPTSSESSNPSESSETRPTKTRTDENGESCGGIFNPCPPGGGDGEMPGNGGDGPNAVAPTRTRDGG